MAGTWAWASIGAARKRHAWEDWRGTDTVRKRTSPNPSNTPEARYTVREVADIYRVTPRTVRHWIDNEELRAWRKGRLIRIPQSALVEFDRAR